MASVTGWTRLEPRTRQPEMSEGLAAQIHDPLWLLTRQWQLGEFKGEDTGSPIIARLQAESALLTRYHPGVVSSGSKVNGQSYDSRKLPLETLVEREPVTPPVHSKPGLAAQLGLRFIQMLQAQGLGTYRQAYLARYPFVRAVGGAFDDASQNFMAVMAGRVPDGERLYTDLRAALRPTGGGPGTLPKEPAVKQADQQKVLEVARSWLTFYESLFSQPTGKSSAWLPERMEYRFSVSAPTGQGEVALVAPEYIGGRLDWYSFNLQPGASLGATTADNAPQLVIQSIIPAPVSFRGMPARRWWEFEDAQVDFGAVAAGPEDLAVMLMLEFALVYGNDWFIIPIELPVGSLCRIRSLVITDTFGERTQIQPLVTSPGTDPTPSFLRLTANRDPIQTKAPALSLFLPPVVGSSLESPPVEEVLLVRDEIANLAWAIERVVESPIGRPLNRYEAYQTRRRQAENQVQATTGPITDAPLNYRLTSTVPDYWLPLLPVVTGPGSIRLRRGRMLSSEGTAEPEPIKPQGRLLEPERLLDLYEEEVSRSGVRLTRSYKYARWINGATFLWVERRKQPGRGESSSNLRYDLLS